MVSSSGKRLATGILTIMYGMTLVVFWLLILSVSTEALLERKWSIGDVMLVLLFASVPILLVLVGGLLCFRNTRSRFLMIVTACCSIALTIKVFYVFNWTLASLYHQDVLVVDSLFRNLFFWIVIIFVLAPCGIWALVMAGTASQLVQRKQSLNQRGEGNAKLSERLTRRKQLVTLWRTVALTLVVQLVGITTLIIVSQPVPPIRIAATELGAQYRDDRAAADARYNGKCLEISGKISERHNTGLIFGFADVTVTLDSGPVTINIRYVFIEYRASGATFDDFNQLSIGQEVVIRGYLRSTEHLLMLDNPILVK